MLHSSLCLSYSCLKCTSFPSSPNVAHLRNTATPMSVRLVIRSTRCPTENCEACFRGVCKYEWPDTGVMNTSMYDSTALQGIYDMTVGQAFQIAIEASEQEGENEESKEEATNRKETCECEEYEQEGENRESDEYEEYEEEGGNREHEESEREATNRESLSKWAGWIIKSGYAAKRIPWTFYKGERWLSVVAVADAAHREGRFGEVDSAKVAKLLVDDDDAGRWIISDGWLLKVPKPIRKGGAKQMASWKRQRTDSTWSGPIPAAQKRKGK